VAQQHPRLDFVRGDTWKIYGTIEDDRGQLMDVSALIASIHWVLANEANVKVVNGADAVVTGVDANQGDILITVPDTVTTTVPLGRYTDYCWIDLTDGRRTKWFGEVYVHAGPPTP
jgi:hypothetical protein